jgi:hypothetical protein
LYVIVRADLAPGYQIPMAIHGVVDYIYKYPEEARDWHFNSDYLVVLNVANEDELFNLSVQADKLNIKQVEYREPDVDNELVSIVLEPGNATKKLCQHLKLALSNLNK